MNHARVYDLRPSAPTVLRIVVRGEVRRPLPLYVDLWRAAKCLVWNLWRELRRDVKP